MKPKRKRIYYMLTLGGEPAAVTNHKTAGAYLYTSGENVTFRLLRSLAEVRKQLKRVKKNCPWYDDKKWDAHNPNSTKTGYVRVVLP